MYKLLPILLFAFLTAEDNQESHFVQSDSLDFIYAASLLDKLINEFQNQVSNIIDEDKLLIKIDKEIYDIIRADTLILDTLIKTKEKMVNNFPPENLNAWEIRNMSGPSHFIVLKLALEVNVDKSINLNDIYKQTIVSIINNIFAFNKWEVEDIQFNSVDINKLKNNKQLSINRDDIYDDSWAVIIGIDKYKYSDQLNYAVKDAEAVKDMLISKFDYPEENIRYLTNEDATLSNIKLNLGEVATSAGREDRILIFYSGHGETSVGADKSETGYIVPYEGKIDNLYATGLAMDDILRTCQLSKSKHMLFLMDACYSGLMTENVKSLSTPSEEGYLNKVANEKARQIITAGGRDEQVIERDEWQHSAFTKNLLAGLDDWESDTDEDGYVTADELGTYLRISVTEDSDFLQTPQKGRFKNSGGGEFVFFSDATITIPSSNIDEEDEIIYGCMDEEANNYNPNATRRDRSCQYGEELTSIKQLVEQYRKSPVASRESNNFQIDEINIPTAQCGMCEKNIENALNGIDGIFKYKVELETYRVQVEYNTDKLSLKIIEKLISKAGYQANNYPADVDAYNKLAKCCKLPKDRR